MSYEVDDVAGCSELGEERVVELPEQSWWKAFCDVSPPTPKPLLAPTNGGASMPSVPALQIDIRVDPCPTTRNLLEKFT